jgi:dihydrofolate synthase/folylpolyglutamate synthase
MLASVYKKRVIKLVCTLLHLKDFRERIKNKRIEISENLLNFITEQLFFETNDMSFFEMTVGLAFDYFATSKLLSIEVGMGGRLDATNIITH